MLDQVGVDALQETFYEPEHKFIKAGRKLRRCESCKRWVTEHDYNMFCRQGLCEYSQEIELDEIKGRSTDSNIRTQ